MPRQTEIEDLHLMVQPIVDPRFLGLLRELRQQAGMSYRALGKAVCYSHAYLCEIERGRKSPTVDIARRLDSVLGADGRLTGLVSEPGLTIDQRDRLADGQRPDTAVVAALAAILAQQRRLEDIVGSAATLAPARAHLEQVMRLVGRASAPTRHALLHLAGEWGQLVGWLHTAVGRHAAAGQVLERATAVARETGDHDLIATLMSFQGHLAYLCGRPAESAELTLVALSEGGVYVGQRAYDALQLGRAYALTGDRRATMNALAEADDLVEEFTEHIGPIPPWQYYRSPGFFRLERGLVYAVLVRDDLSASSNAITDLRAGLAGLPIEQQGAEWAGDYQLALAAVHARTGDEAAAREVLDSAEAVAMTTGSARLAGQVRTLARTVR